MWKVTLLWGKNGVGSGDQGYRMERSLIFIFGRVIRVAFLRTWCLNKDLKVASYMIKSFWIQKNNRTNSICVCIPIHIEVCIHTHTQRDLFQRHGSLWICLLLTLDYIQVWLSSFSRVITDVTLIFSLHPVIWHMPLVSSVTSWCQLRALE